MVDKGHGRVEVRTLEVTTWLADDLGTDWPGCRQVFRLRREQRYGVKVEVEVVFGITSLARERAGAAELLNLTRTRWGIENGRHFRRDGTLHEDAGRTRRGAGPQVMAIMRNIVIYLHRLWGRQASRLRPAVTWATRRNPWNFYQPQVENETAQPCGRTT